MRRKYLIAILSVSISSLFYSQNLDEKKLTKELSENACKCIDSIYTSNRDKAEVVQDIHRCIDEQTGALQLGSMFSKIEDIKKDAPLVDGKKQINVEFNTDKNSNQYKENYNKIERTVMDNCPRVKTLMGTAETKDAHFSENGESVKFYSEAIDFSKKEDWQNAIKSYKASLKKDPKFIYAWDNLGICYRRLGEYDNAIDAYKHSLAIDPTGKMPLQNIAISYIYKEQYQKAIDAYLDLDRIYPGDAEVYYGIGQIYTMHLKNYQNGLHYILKAYKLYNQQKSPYRTDAEKLIAFIHKGMKDENKLDQFNKILLDNGFDMK